MRSHRWPATLLALLVVWFALVAPDRPADLGVGALLRIPAEGLVAAAVLLVVPTRARGRAAVAIGALLGALTVVRLLDLGLYAAIGKPFNLGTDWVYVGSSEGLVDDSIGRVGAVGVVVATVLLVVVLMLLLPWAVLRLSRSLTRHRTAAARAIGVLAVAWLGSAALGLAVTPGVPLASSAAARLAVSHVVQARAGLLDRDHFAHEVSVDHYTLTPRRQLLAGLEGKDVVVAFVESYGRVALEGPPSVTGPVDTALASGTRRLDTAGWSSRSAFLTSPTFGGISWLAHSTLQSGLWVDSQQRYEDLVRTDRLTLSDAFGEAGWRTVSVVPSDRKDWPVGRRFYGYDHLYDSTNLGYAGPTFSYASMPDEYALAEFARRELAPTGRPPVMAEIDLVSSHAPWAPLPRMVPWGAVGDGSVFEGMPAQGERADVVWRDPQRVQAAYGQSIAYSLDALVSFVENQHDDNLVLVVLGDHQPASIVSGPEAGHDVPVTVIAHDATVLDRISGWGWQDGLRPSAEAPVWPMDAFRDRFLAAFDSPSE